MSVINETSRLSSNQLSDYRDELKAELERTEKELLLARFQEDCYTVLSLIEPLEFDMQPGEDVRHWSDYSGSGSWVEARFIGTKIPSPFTDRPYHGDELTLKIITANSKPLDHPVLYVGVGTKSVSKELVDMSIVDAVDNFKSLAQEAIMEQISLLEQERINLT